MGAVEFRWHSPSLHIEVKPEQQVQRHILTIEQLDARVRKLEPIVLEKRQNNGT